MRKRSTGRGVEVAVVAGKVTAVNDREKTRSAAGTTVPANGYVLSGHGAAAEWLRAQARTGAVVTRHLLPPLFRWGSKRSFTKELAASRDTVVLHATEVVTVVSPVGVQIAAASTTGAEIVS